MAATRIRGRQIEPGEIDNSHIKAAAGIATSKLADGANFLLKDGSVAMTGNFNLNSNKLVGVANGTAGTDGINLGQLNAAIAALNSVFDNKPSAKAATTGNINISNPGTATFDTVTLSNGEILFVRAQTAPAENGLYTFNGSGVALTRIPEMDAWNEIPGAFFAVEAGGSTWGNSLWLCTAASGGTLGTTAITFQQANAAGLTSSNFVTREVPSGAINGSNVTYTLANTPVAGSEEVFVNGVLQEPGAGNDYTISGATITMLTAMATGEKIVVNYRK